MAPFDVGGFDEVEPVMRRDQLNGQLISDMSYKEWEQAKKDLNSDDNRSILKQRIDSGEISLTLNPKKQNPHILGTQEYNPESNKSYFSISYDQLQRIVNSGYATGDVKITPSGQIKELLSLDRNIGTCIDSSGGIIGETNRVTIHYSKNRTHAVPARRDVVQ